MSQELELIVLLPYEGLKSVVNCMRENQSSVSYSLQLQNHSLYFNFSRHDVQSSQQNWPRVLFTDEFRYSLNTNSRGVLNWREKEIHNLPSLVREISRFRDLNLIICKGRNLII